MKKLLALFVVLDFIFVGLILKFTPSQQTRMVSSVNDSAYNELTEGQKNKWHLVETLKFQISSTEITLETDKLQMIEKRMTLEGRLNRLNSKIQKQYPQTPDLAAEVNIKNEKAKLKKKALQSDSKTDDVQVTDQIILQK